MQQESRHGGPRNAGSEGQGGLSELQKRRCGGSSVIGSSGSDLACCDPLQARFDTAAGSSVAVAKQLIDQGVQPTKVRNATRRRMLLLPGNLQIDCSGRFSIHNIIASA